MNHKNYYFQMEVKATSSDANGKKIVKVKGFASTPDIDRGGDIVEPTAFTDAIKSFMTNPVVLFQHDDTKPVGTITSAIVTEKGLQVEAEINDEDTQTKVMDGRLRAFSIGWIPLEIEFRHKDGAAYNPITDSIFDPDMVRVIKSLDLIEISIVTTPMNGNALFSVSKSIKSYFTDAATKSMPMKNKKDASETTQEAVKPPEAAVPPVEEKDETQATEVTDEKAVETAPEATPAAPAPTEAPAPAPAATEAPAPTTTPTNGEKPTEEDEKGDEKAPADSPEAPKGEEGKAESKPEATEEGKSLIVSKSVATALPELVQAGLLVESKEAGKGVDLPKEIVGLMRKMADAYILAAKQVEALEKEIKNTPAKSALKVHGQFGGNDAPAPAKKEVGRAFKGLFGGQV